MKRKKKHFVVGISIAMIAILTIVAIVFLLKNQIFASPTDYLTNPSVRLYNYTIPSGYSTFGTNVDFPTNLLTDKGLSVYAFDGVNNKWLVAPGDSFYIKSYQGLYIYNPSSAKTVALPAWPEGTWSNLYWVTKGWNMIYTSHDQTRANLQIQAPAPNAWSLQFDAAVAQDKALPSVFIINNYQSRVACEYFTLLESAAAPANCASNSLQKVTAVPNGKAFWVYVK